MSNTEDLPHIIEPSGTESRSTAVIRIAAFGTPATRVGTPFTLAIRW